MSVPVDLAELGAALERYAYAFLVTVNADRAAHLVAVVPRLEDGRFVVGGLGRTTSANATATPTVTLVWPPTDPTDYSLIVDGTARVGDDAVTVTPSRAVLHRAAVDADGARVGNDCVDLKARSGDVLTE